MSDELYIDSDLKPWRLVEVQKDGAVEVYGAYEKNPLTTIERMQDRLDSMLGDKHICKRILRNPEDFPKSLVELARHNLRNNLEKAGHR